MRRVGAAILILICHGVSPTAAQELPACPGAITVSEEPGGAAPEGWTLRRRPSEHRLVDVRFHEGSPPEAQAIEPVAGSGSGNVFGLRYQLADRAGPVWMSCHYADTATMLAREVQAAHLPNVRVNYDRQSRAVYLSYF